MTSTSELSKSQNVFLPNLNNELKALTTTILQSPSNFVHYQNQNKPQSYPTTIYSSITIPSVIVKFIIIDKKNKTQ